MTVTNNGFTYYDRSENKEWNKILFLAGRNLQSAELNEIQSVLETYQSRLGRSIFKDGDIISGCQIRSDTDKKELYITDGLIFIDGRIRFVSGRSTSNPLVISASGEEDIGLSRSIIYITEDDDSSLRDPVQDWGVFGDAGAHREKYVYDWVVDDETAVSVFSLINGQQKVIERPTQYSQLYEALARRTFDESGNYSVDRFLMRAEANPDGTSTDNFAVVVEPAKAYVKGYELELGAPQSAIIDKGRDTQRITAELQVKSPYSNLYELNSDFVKEVVQLSAPVFKDTTVARGGHPGGKDRSPYTPLFKVIAINQGGTWDETAEDGTDCSRYQGSFIGGTDFQEGVDWYQEGNHINWSLGGSEPTPGSTYNVALMYTRNMVIGERDKTEVPLESVSRDATASIDWLSYYDGVQGSLQFVDNVGNPIPGTYYEGIDYEFITGNNPADSLITGEDYSNYIGKVGIYWYPNANNKPFGTYYVKYSYWSHTKEGDFVAANSYSSYEDITVNEVSSIFYRDFIDFRPLKGSTKTNEPYDEENFTTTYDIYLGRSDLVSLNQYGEIKVLRGRPSTVTIRPDEMEGTLTIGWAYVPPYTYNLSNVEFSYKENLRFTMLDIHRLEDRIDRLEYFMLIDVLEQNAMGQFTSNPKKGVFVDSFQGSKNADINYNDGTNEFSVAFNQENQSIKLQPILDQTDTRSVVDGGSTTARLGKYNYTLPFSEVALANQRFATNSLTVQPFEVFTWFGELEADPEADTWVDTERGNDITANFENEMAHARTLDTVWGGWQDVSTGRPIVSDVRREQDRVSGGIETTTVTSGFTRVRQERQGTRIQAVPGQVTQRLGDRVTNLSIAPFMRGQRINVTGEGLRPNVDNIKLSFDEKDMSTNIVPDGGTYVTGTGSNTRIKSDSLGHCEFSFDIPSGQFRIGRKEIRITNEEEALPGNKTYASCIFEAYGLSQTKQDVVATTTVTNLRTETVSQRRRVRRPFSRRETNFRRIQETSPPDPLAQSFITSNDEVTYISSIDVYFKDKDPSVPVTVFLRTMDNGYPAKRILAKKTLYPSQVNTSEDSSVATNFAFDDPIMVEPNTELCFVVYSASPNYTCYFSELGEVDILTGLRIIKNPYSGVMFTAANQSTWQPDGFKDLKFTVYRCNFENDCQLVFDNITGIEASLLVLQSSQIIPDATEIKWFYSTDDGSNYNPINPLNNTQLSSVTTQVKLRADITGTGLSPQIHKDRLGIIFVNHKEDGKYISRLMDMPSPCTDLKIVLDEYIPSGTEVNVYYQLDEDNVWRDTFDTIDNVVIDERWTEFEYEITGLSSFTQLRVMIEFETTTAVVSPEARRLRVICSG